SAMERQDTSKEIQTLKLMFNKLKKKFQPTKKIVANIPKEQRYKRLIILSKQKDPQLSENDHVKFAQQVLQIPNEIQAIKLKIKELEFSSGNENQNDDLEDNGHFPFIPCNLL